MAQDHNFKMFISAYLIQSSKNILFIIIFFKEKVRGSFKSKFEISKMDICRKRHPCILGPKTQLPSTIFYFFLPIKNKIGKHNS